MIEILSILDTRDSYYKYKDIVNRYNIDIDIKRIIDSIDIYYKETTIDTIDWNNYSTYFFIKNPLIKEDKRILFESIFTKLTLLDHSLRSSLVETFLERYHAQRISFLSGEVAEGKAGKSLQAVSDELQAYFRDSKRVGSTEDSACRDDLQTLLQDSAPGTGLEWRLGALNDSLGELHKGKLGLFAGRPDSGKSTMLISEGTHMAQQLPDDKRVYYFVDEEDGSAYKPRIIGSLLGVDRRALEANPKDCWDEYIRRLGGNPDKIILVDQPSISVNDIERWIKDSSAGLIIIDQLRNLGGFNDVKGVQRTEQLFKWAREICKEYAPVLTVGQLDGEAEGEAYPSMNRLYESKTAAQGALDFMVTIGRIDGSIPANARYLGVVKNKMPSPRVASLRKGRHEVIILEDIGRFK